MNASSPASASTRRNSIATGTASANPVPGCGSRSIRNSSGLSGLPAREGQGWKTTVFICTAHTAAAISSMTSWGCERPLG